MVLIARLAGTSQSPGIRVSMVTSESGVLRTSTSKSVFVKAPPSSPRHLVAWPWLSRSTTSTR